ncbi:Lcl C-terminal domain-containing protein [Endothiovibrio diazotrophicus]
MKFQHSKVWQGVAAALLCGGMGSAHGADTAPAGGEPPAEAITACDGQSSGASCSFDTPNGTVAGSCALLESQMSCVPEGASAPPTGSDVPTDTPTDTSGAAPTDYASYDGVTQEIFLPELDAGAYGRYSLSLRVEGFDPITLALDSATLQPATPSASPDAVFDPDSGGLTISRLLVGEQWYVAALQLIDGDAFLFELVDLSESDAGTDSGTSDSGTSGTDTGDASDTSGVANGYPIVDTNQSAFYGDTSGLTTPPRSGEAFYGQDAQYSGNQPSYTDNGDGTVTDNVTGLMWQQDPDFNGDGVIDVNDKMTFSDASDYAASFNLAGYSDWRLPTVKELYSLIEFSGATGTSDSTYSVLPDDAAPYIDTNYFYFAYGDTAAGERYIDAQYWSSTVYTSTTIGDSATAFGVNFADGRIKGYPYGGQMDSNGRFVRYVRGNTSYGINLFSDNGDGTISDQATGLMWLQSDSGSFGVGDAADGAVNWEQALAWCEGLEYAGYSDWRLPNAKELESLIDYSRSPDATNSAAIDSLFSTTLLADGINASGVANYPYFWSGTTHNDGPNSEYAAYLAFGEARGYFNDQLMDVHGAGAQRSDPKSGDPSVYAGVGHGPQGDVIGIYNYARCVRTNDVN